MAQLKSGSTAGGSTIITDADLGNLAYLDSITASSIPNEAITVSKLDIGTDFSGGFQYVVALSNGTFAVIETSLNGPADAVFTSSGTWTKPAGVQYVGAYVMGGGGGGGDAGAYSGYNSYSGGGGGGGYAVKMIDVSAVSSVSVTVGAGGAGGTGTGADGVAGGTTSFGSYVSATGGSGGDGRWTDYGWSGVSATRPGGVGSGGDLNYTGSPGPGGVYPSGAPGGDGYAPWGWTGGVPGGYAVSSPAPAGHYGSGGGGAHRDGHVVSTNGGNGMSGVVRLIYINHGGGSLIDAELEPFAP